MPLLLMEGRLLSPMLICLQESSGNFGPNVQNSMYKPVNLVIKCSRSGKMDKEMMRDFVVNVVQPNIIDDKVCLILDSWSGQSDNLLYDLPGKTIVVKTIPAGATSFMQPLDIFCFRQWKYFVKKFTEDIMLNDYQINMHLRDNVIQLNSLILNQLQSDLFTPMLKYAWHKGGFPIESIARYESVNEICFEIPAHSCSQNCTNLPFICCSYRNCRKFLCLPCFFTKNHGHSNSN